MKGDARGELLKNRFPEDNTLLADLRSQSTHWAYDIGRVIRPELLQLKNLAPEYNKEASQDTFFGWTLDLEQIELSEEALSNEVLDAKIQNLEVEMSGLSKQIKEEEKRIRNLEREDTRHNGILVNYNTTLRELKGDIAAAKEQITQVQGEIRAAIESRKAGLQDKLKAAEKRLARFEAERQEKIDNRVKIYGQKVIDAIAHMNRELSKIEENIEAQDVLLKDLKTACDKRIKLTEEKYDERYRKEGLDPEIMREAREAKEAAEAKLKTVKGYLRAITEYKSWLENEWGEVNNLEEKEHDLKLDVEARNITIQQLIEAHNESIKETRSELESLRKLNRDLKALINDARVVMGNMSFNADGPMLDLRDIKLLTEKLKTTNIAINNLGKEVSDGVRRVTRIFAKYSSSQVSEAWDNLENTRKNKSQQLEGSREFEIEQAQDLKILLSNFIPQIRGTLLENVRSFGQSICNYHETLKQITSRIKRISTELGTAINSNQRIGSIRDVNIILESRIEQFECWEYLNQFSTEWEGWRSSHTTNELPTERVIEALRVANESLNDANIKDEKASLLNLKISMNENDNHRFIGTDSDFNNSSSNGLSYLAICIVFMGMARYLCPDHRVQLAWPIDELAALSPNNIASLFAMMDEKNIVMFSAFPSEDPTLLKHFESKNLLSQSGIRRIAMKKAISGIEEIKRRNQAVKKQKAEAEEQGVVEV